MRAHDRAALREQRTRLTPAQEREYYRREAARRADITRECDICGYEMASHCPTSVVRNRKEYLHCPEHLGEAPW